MPDITLRIPATMAKLAETVSSLIELMEAQVARGASSGPSAYDAFEEAVAEKVAAIECAAHEPALTALDIDAPGVTIDGRMYRRVLRSTASYYTRAGAVSIERSLYREAGNRESPAIDVVSPRDTYNLAGLAYSNDFGRTWIRNGQLPIPACLPDVQGCVRNIVSDPWLATNGSKVLYAMMANIDLPSGFRATNTVIVSSSTDGINFGAPVPLVRASAHLGFDHPSISFVGSVAAVAVVAEGVGSGDAGSDDSLIALATSDDEGATWLPLQLLSLPMTSGNIGLSPIVKLTGPEDGYLAYFEAPFATVVTTQTATYHVVRLSRTLTPETPWTTREIFRSPVGTFTARYPAANGRMWRDIFPLSFEIGPRGWTPCPSPVDVDYLGDYLGSVIIPRTRPGADPYVVTAYADSSGGCEVSDAITNDQHVTGVVWP